MKGQFHFNSEILKLIITPIRLPWWLSWWRIRLQCRRPSPGDKGSIPGSGRSPGEWNGNPLQYSCLENPMDRGAWWATVHGVARIKHDLVTKPRKSKTVFNFYINRLFTYLTYDLIHLLVFAGENQENPLKYSCWSWSFFIIFNGCLNIHIC